MKYIIIILLFWACSQEKTSETNNNKIRTKNCFGLKNKKLYHKIVAFVDTVSKIPRSKELQNIIEVYFYKENKKCYFNLATNYFYKKEKLDGFLLINDFMVSFYDVNNPCNDKIVEKKNLNHITPVNKYLNNHTALHGPFEPFIRKYEILKPDSFKLISSIRY